MDFKRFFYSIIRFGNSHGFGVQSPFAYRFIKDVAMESYPYYAYASLAAKYPNDKDVIFHRFLLRFSNFMQSKPWCLLDSNDIDTAYILAGCKNYNIFNSYDKECGALVVKDMNRWNELLSKYQSGLSFDLYDCGVIFFSLNVQSGHYKCVLKS